MPDNCCTQPIVTTPNPDLTCCCTNCGESSCGKGGPNGYGVAAGDPGECGCGSTQMTGPQDDTVSGGCKPTRSGLKSCTDICQPTSCGGPGGGPPGGPPTAPNEVCDSNGCTISYPSGNAGGIGASGGGIGSIPGPVGGTFPSSGGGGGSCGTSCGCSSGNGPGNDPVKYANNMANSVQLQAHPNVPNPGPGSINLGTGNVNFSITPPGTGAFSPSLNLNYIDSVWLWLG